MDNITHTLTGLMLARCGLGRTTKTGGALMLMIAANIPDVDVFASGWPGGLRYLQYHRGYTHSLILAPVMALASLLLAKWIRKASITRWTYLACLIGVFSHLAMDWTNTYGIRLLLPFSSRWLRLDTTNIIDPWILFIFFIALAVPALAGLVSSEIQGRKTASPKYAWAWFAIIAVLSYEGFRLAAHQRAIAVMEARLYGSETPPRFAAIPDLIDPLRWRGIVETEEAVLNVPILLTEPYDPNFGEVDYPAQKSQAIDAAKTTRPFQIFEQFNQLPFWKVTPLGDFIRVELIDMRFGTPRHPGFAVASALVNPDGHVREAHFGFPIFQ
ncbi:MAG TPA: metal-dependent hydrolase [Bryobacteraceae bacterium]|nr:metal-dependent hydrolase [Bryobacteraceae bacterium]